MARLITTLGIITVLAFIVSGIVFAQTSELDGVSQTQIDTALSELSSVYGSPITRTDQAKAICNQEQYFVDCAEIGKRNNLFSEERAEQVDIILTEIKGKFVNELKQCADIDCLINVATSIAKNLNNENSSVANKVELTPQIVKEKRAIVDTAKSIGVDFEQCRTMNPDTASIELLRGCARLAKHKDIQQYIPDDVKKRADRADTSIALKESLQNGEFQCGDGTLEGCGNFCLNSSSETRKAGEAAIPPICLQIANKFFGEQGADDLKRAYSNVQQTFDNATKRAQNVLFKTTDGRALTNLQEIGRYLENAGRAGDVEAVKHGIDFLILKGFANQSDKDFALKMVGNIKDKGLGNFDFDKCRANPEQCEEFVPEENRGNFAIMNQIDRIMRAELGSRGVTDPFQCELDSSKGQSCMEAAKATLPQIEPLAKTNPEVSFFINDIKQKIRFSEEGIGARKRAEEQFLKGEVKVGDKNFRSMTELEDFCRINPNECLAETAREGFFSRDVATEKYQRAAELQFNKFRDIQQSSFPDFGFSDAVQMPFQRQDTEFNKEEIMAQFEKWLDNPQGPPPTPGFQQPYNPQNQYRPDGGQYPYPYSSQPYPGQYPKQYQQQSNTNSPYYQGCPYTVIPYPCPNGQYRQESVDEFGCYKAGACIPINTNTAVKPIDGRFICPAIPTVESCPAGEEKTITYSSPECGTFYSCRPINKSDGSINFPHTLSNGKILTSLEEARNYCRAYGLGSGQGISAECEKKFGIVYSQNLYPSLEENGSSYRSGIYFNPAFTSCMDRLGSREASGKIQNWLNSGIIPPPWNELSNKGQSDVATCEREVSSITIYSVPTDDRNGVQCEKYGNGWHTMDSSGNCFNPEMTQYRTHDNILQFCANSSVYGCSNNYSVSTTTAPVYYTPQQGQTEQIWNNFGLRSWIRSDADSARIAALKQACANVKSGLTSGYSSDVWMPNAGNSSSIDFGMPDPQKCAAASASNCGDGQYFDGTNCVSDYSDNPPLLGDCRNNTNQSQCITQPGCKWFTDQNGNYCEGDNYIPPTNTSSYIGDASSCPGFAYSRWDSTGARYCQLNTVKSCQFFYPQYLDANNYTVNGCPSDTTVWQQDSSISGSCSSELIGLLGDGCHSMGNAWFDGQMTKYVFPGGSTIKNCTLESISGCSSGGASYNTCSYGQYWDGNACVNNPSSPSTSCGSEQYWDGNACVNNPSSYADPQQSCASAGGTWDSASNYCNMPNSYQSGSTSCGSNQYWDGNACVNNPSSPSTSCGSEQYWDGNACVTPPPPPPSDTSEPVSYFCPSGHNWNGSYCTLAQESKKSRSENYVATVLNAILSIFDF